MNGSFYQSFRVFISSPGDVKDERQAAEEEIQSVSVSCRDTLGISVDCIKWEHLRPVIQPAGVRTQDVINEDLVRACNCFVLNRYSEVARFHIRRGNPKRAGSIFWRSPTGREIEIRAPLGAYLSEQRHDHPGGEWVRQHSRIVAKDYAILARFSDRSDLRPSVSGTLKDYFVGGIHGLGTWGAGWFIDRRYNVLQRCAQEEDSPIQLLLEVTYRDERIADVKDVSQEPASYFRSEGNPETVKKRVSEFVEWLT